MRRPIILLVLCALPLALPPSARAQELGPVDLSLARQTPWNEPGRRLGVSVRALWPGPGPLADLSIAVTVADRVTSRSQYEASLTEAVTPALSTSTIPLKGRLRAGVPRVIPVEVDPEAILLAAGRHATGVFPVTVELRSAGDPVATLRTPMVYLARRAELPLALTWTFVLHEPITQGPDGVFQSPALERTLAQGGALSAELTSIASMLTGPRPHPVNVVLSPTLLRQLDHMRGGYRVVVGTEVEEVGPGESGAADAARALGFIEQIAAADQTEIAAMPYAAPNLPAMVKAGLHEHLRRQVSLGFDDVRTLAGAAASPRLLYPPDSIVDEASLARLFGMDARVVFLEAGQAVVPPQDRGFAPPPIFRLDLGDDRTMNAVVPDPGLQAMLAFGRVRDDPRLGAQAVLGMLASIWQEQPGRPRGVAMLFSNRLSLPGGFFESFVRNVTLAPWLRTVKATGMIAQVPPPEDPVPLVAPIYPSFSDEYLARLRLAQDDIGTYRSVLVEDSPAVAELETLILLSESGTFIGLERLGLSYLDHVSGDVSAFLGSIRPDLDAGVTLASRTGIVPVGLSNGTGEPVRVSVRLLSSRLRFLQGDSRDVVLDRATGTLTFQVEAQQAGQFPVRVLIRTPSGVTIAQGELVVRATALNPVALVVTIGAALFLVAGWARHVVRRRTAKAS